MTGGDKALLDTGPLVALLDSNERAHVMCVKAMAGYRGIFLTTEPVLTEAMYLLGRTAGGQGACLEFVLRGGCILVPMTRPTLVRCRMLMDTYADIPMDFADATLVALAEEIGLERVFSLDRRGFSAYRPEGRRAFHLMP